jgi:hypothetical protein
MKAQWESFKVTGDELLERIRALLREGNVRRVVIEQDGRTIAEFPVTVGVVAALAAPVLAAIGAMAAILTHCTVYVQRADAKAATGRAKASARPSARIPARKKTERGR